MKIYKDRIFALVCGMVAGFSFCLADSNTTKESKSDRIIRHEGVTELVYSGESYFWVWDREGFGKPKWVDSEGNHISYDYGLGICLSGYDLDNAFTKVSGKAIIDSLHK